MSDTERFAVEFWDMAPERWVTADSQGSFRVSEADIVGGPGSEQVVLVVERSDGAGEALEEADR